MKAISKTDHEKGYIPKFFSEIWTQRNNESPFENEKRFISVFLSLFVTCALWVAAFLVFSFELICAVILSSIFLFALWKKAKNTDPEKFEMHWHFREYYELVTELFRLFHITPSETIGKMSRERFLKAVSETLREKAIGMQIYSGFTEMQAMEEWKRMHESAKFWGLCDEKYDRYFSQTPVKS